MKKYLFGALVLAAAMMVGCKGTDEPQHGIEKIELKPAETTLALGAKITLTPVLTPATAKGQYTWTSSDSTIVTVDQKGNCEALALGEAVITVTETQSKLTSTSKITVKSELESLTWGQAFLYGMDDDPALTDTITFDDGEVCLKWPIEFIVMSEGFFIDESGYLQGKGGAMIEMPSYVLYAPKELNPGATRSPYYCLGRWSIDDALYNEGMYYCGQKGEYTQEYHNMAKGLVKAYNDQDADGFYGLLEELGSYVKGTTMSLYEYQAGEDGEEGGFLTSYVANAVLTDATFDLDGSIEGSSQLMVGLNYMNMTFVELDNDFFGLDVEENEETETLSFKSDNLLTMKPVTVTTGKPVYDKQASKKNLIELPENYFQSAEYKAMKSGIDALKANAKHKNLMKK